LSIAKRKGSSSFPIIPRDGKKLGKLIIIPKPELSGFGGISLNKPPVGVTSAEVAMICLEKTRVSFWQDFQTDRHASSSFSTPGTGLHITGRCGCHHLQARPGLSPHASGGQGGVVGTPTEKPRANIWIRMIHNEMS